MTKTERVIKFFVGEYSFLSNFEGGVEQKFQAAKSLDDGEATVILQSPPGLAKRMGNQIKLRPDWDAIKYEIMEKLVREKFQRAGYRLRLLATGDAELIEGNTWHDNIWGDCVCTRCHAKGPGKNWLGKILMKVRSELASRDPENLA